MSVYPLFLVLGSDGTIGAYAREDILRIDLQQNMDTGQAARQVYALDQHSMTVSYHPAPEFALFTEPWQNLCERHKREALPKPTSSTCVQCAKEQKKAATGKDK